MINYKKIIKSRYLRKRLLSLLEWIPDRIMVQLQYYIKTGRRLNLRNPKRFTEKLQLYKLFYRNSTMLQCTDKFEVRDFVRKHGYTDILIPMIGVYDSPIEIIYETLPSKFVVKTTDGGGGNRVIVCKDKNNIDKNSFYRTLSEWMSFPKTKSSGREWAYENGYPRRLIVEQLIGNDQKELIDYKFFCFNGKVKMVYGISGRDIGNSAQLGIYSPEFTKLQVNRNDERVQTEALDKPQNYEMMIKIAEDLSKEFPHVRVDLYNVDGKIYFGELTFYDGSGYMTFSPDSYDMELGEYFKTDTFYSN